MHKVWDNGAGLRGYVSMEVSPNLAYDTEGTYEQAQRFHELIDRPNLYVKIPATKPGLGAIEDCIGQGAHTARDRISAGLVPLPLQQLLLRWGKG